MQKDQVIQLAQSEWVQPESVKYSEKIVKDLFSLMANQEALLFLESSSYLEKYLWPHITETSTREHIISCLAIINQKLHANNSDLSFFSESEETFEVFFSITLKCFLGENVYSTRTQFIKFLTNLLRHLDVAVFRKCSFGLLNAGILKYLSEDSRQKAFKNNPGMEAYYENFVQSENFTELESKVFPLIVRSFRDDVISLGKATSESTATTNNTAAQEEYLKHVLAFFIEILASKSTRRFARCLLSHFNVASVLPHLSGNGKGKFTTTILSDLMLYYYYIPIEDDEVLYNEEDLLRCNEEAARGIRKIAFKKFEGKIADLALVNQASLFDAAVLSEHFQKLSVSELIQVCGLLGVLHEDEKEDEKVQKEILIKALVWHFDRKEVGTERRILLTCPQYCTENMGKTADNFLLPKTSLQFLTTRDYLLRTYLSNAAHQKVIHGKFLEYNIDFCHAVLQKKEDTLDEDEDMEGVGSGLNKEKVKIGYRRVNRNCVSVAKFEISKMGEKDVTCSSEDDVPLRTVVEGRLVVDVESGGGSQPHVRNHWESLSEHHVIYLIRFSRDDNKPGGNKQAVECIRGCVVRRVEDEEGNVIDNFSTNNEKSSSIKKKQSSQWALSYGTNIIVEMDRYQYAMDKGSKIYSRRGYFDLAVLDKRPDVCVRNISLMNIRRFLENNNKETTTLLLPEWGEDVILGNDSQVDRIPGVFEEFEVKSLKFPQKIDVEVLEKMIGNMDEGYVVKNECERQKGPFNLRFSVVSSSNKMDTSESDSEEEEEDDDEVVLTITNSTEISDEDKKKKVELTQDQCEAVLSGILPGITVISGKSSSGKTVTVAELLKQIHENFPQNRSLVLSHTAEAAQKLIDTLNSSTCESVRIVSLGDRLSPKTSAKEVVEKGELVLSSLLKTVRQLALSLFRDGSKNGDGDSAIAREKEKLAHVGYSVETALYFYHAKMKPVIERIRNENAKKFFDNCTMQQACDKFPLIRFFYGDNEQIISGDGMERNMRDLEKLFEVDLKQWQFLELIHNSFDRANFVHQSWSNVVVCTLETYLTSSSNVNDLIIGEIDNMVMLETCKVPELATTVSIVRANVTSKRGICRLVLSGDPYSYPLVVPEHSGVHCMGESIIQRLRRVNVSYVSLDTLFSPVPQPLLDLYKEEEDAVKEKDSPLECLGGIAIHGVDVGPFKGNLESTPYGKHADFAQNLGEAEYAVHVFMYLRLRGVPQDDIAILSATRGQKKLVKEVLRRRCRANPVFNVPAVVETVRSFVCGTNRKVPVVILSLVKTQGLGEGMRGSKFYRGVVSRASKALVVVHNREFFSRCFPLFYEEFSAIGNGGGLTIVDDEGKRVGVKDLEQFGRIVFEMTKTKMAMMKEKQDKFFEEILSKK